MAKKRSTKHTARAIVRLSLPLICTVALGGPSLIPAYAEENQLASPTNSGGEISGSYNGTDGTGGGYGSSSSNGGGSNTDGGSGNSGGSYVGSGTDGGSYVGGGSYGSSSGNSNSNNDGSGSSNGSDGGNTNAVNTANVNESTTNGTDNTANGTESESGQVGLTSSMTLMATNTTGNFSTQQTQQVSYDYDAELYRDKLDPSNQKQYAGVYATDPLEQNAPDPAQGQTTGVVEVSDDQAKTIGMPSIADANLPDAPTTESPAFIVGTAVGYETRTVNPDGSITYGLIDENTPRDTVYDEFKRSEVSEQKPGQTTAHKKITGYDGTYVIVRLDVSKYFEGDGTPQENPSYLHVKQEDNNTLLTATGMTKVEDGLKVTGPMIVDEKGQQTALLEGNTFTGIPQATGTSATDQTDKTKTYTLQWQDKDASSNKIIRTGSYTKEQLTDATDNKQYLDVLVFATASNVAGADVGKEGQLTGDVPVSMYVDQINDYNPDYKYDPTSADPFLTANVLGKFYDATKAAANTIVKVSKYIVKGSDLALETMVKESGGTNNEETTYWSLVKSFEKPYYDQSVDRTPNDSRSGRTVSLMSEVAVTQQLNLEGTSANNLRKRTLDVNSFDVQVATNTGQEAVNKVGFNLKNAWLTIADFSNTTGSEFAIGNNSTCTVDEGGRLIIDETSQLEIEWDGATKTPAPGEKAPEPDILNNGFLDLKKGGTVVNNGVITIEGTEGKPYAPETKEAAVASEKGCGEFLVNEGATLINNGCMIVYGRLYNFGTVENNGHFDDTIDSTDPDKGTFSYHKGIQVSWKDDVTQQNIIPGGISNGRSRDGNKIVESATIVNRGDILLAPGELINYGTIDNQRSGYILECPVEGAWIPIELLPTDPADKEPIQWMTVEEIYKKRDPNDPNPKKVEESYIYNHGNVVNRGFISTGNLTLGKVVTDVFFDKLTMPSDHADVFIYENIGDSGATLNYGIIPGVPTIPEPQPQPMPEPEPEPAPRQDIPSAPVAQDSSDSSSSDSSSSAAVATKPADGEQKPSDSKTTIRRITKNDSADKPVTADKPAAEQTIANTVQAAVAQISVGDADVEVRVVADPKIEQIADGVYEIVEMPEVEIEAITEDGNHSAENLEEAWWCVEIDGEKVRVMNTHGKLAAGIARVLWADNADLAQATLVGIDLGDGQVIVIGPDTELFLDIVWS